MERHIETLVEALDLPYSATRELQRLLELWRSPETRPTPMPVDRTATPEQVDVWMLPARAPIDALVEENDLPEDFRSAVYALLDMIRADAQERPTLANGAPTLAPRATYTPPDPTQTRTIVELSPDEETPRPAPPRTTAPATPAGRGFAERFDDVGVLGIGGMGEVRRVIDQDLKRYVAMKAIKPDLARSDQIVQRFVAEAQATGQLQHPGIVPVYELGKLPDGRPYFTMQEVRGRQFGILIASWHRARNMGIEADVSLRRLIDILLKVCETVAYAHSKHIIHRDLKPENIMVGDYGEVLVVDWGLARVARTGNDDAIDDLTLQSLGAGQTSFGRIAGTPSYMPLEQAVGDLDSQGPWSDVYALGSTLYEILAGRPPYEAEDGDGYAILAQLTEGPPPVPPEGPHIPEPLRQICLKALEREPQDRYPSAKELAEEIDAFLEGARKRERAMELLSEARSKSANCVRLRQRADAVRDQAHQFLGADLPPAQVRRNISERETQARRLDQGAETLEVVVSQLASSALAQVPDLPEAHDFLARHYHRLHKLAEARGAATERHRTLLKYHDQAGRYGSYLDGAGRLSLHTDPPGAKVEIFEYVAKDRRLTTRPYGEPLTTPLVDVPLPMGSYLCLIQADGRATVRYPVHIGREEHWDGVPPGESEAPPLVLPKRHEVAPDEVYVPAGWFVSGGDAPNALARRRLWLDAFVMKRFPVTHADYLAFLNALVRERRTNEAELFEPRIEGIDGDPGTGLYRKNRHGIYALDRKRTPENVPVVYVPWNAALTFGAWMASTGSEWRLPNELQWEKAARGVDGRAFPWGPEHDPSWAAMMESGLGRGPFAIDRHKTDLSPFGVVGMGGNVRDWCRNAFTVQGPPIKDARLTTHGKRRKTAQGEPYRSVRGGHWRGTLDEGRVAARYGLLEDTRAADLGFRLVRSI